jgi:FG-GAP-like repeat
MSHWLHLVRWLFPVEVRQRRRGRVRLWLVELETRRLLSLQLLGPVSAGFSPVSPSALAAQKVQLVGVAQREFSAGFSPSALAVADVNGDGVPDIIAANAQTNTVSILLGNGDGTFQAPLSFPVGRSPDALAIAVLGNSFLPELPAIITASGEDNDVSVLTADVSGGFQVTGTYPTGNAPVSLAVTDVNGDGIPDIVTANEGGNDVSVLLGNSDGTFQAAHLFAVGSFPVAVAAGNLTGNLIPDLVTTNALSNSVSVLVGNGDGTFQPQKTFPVGSDPAAVALADLTGNGKLDIITANSNDNDVSVLLGNGNGTFLPQQTFAVGNVPRAVAVADLTGNGKLDIITANSSNNDVSVLLGNGDGTFQPQQTFVVGNDPVAVALADLTDNGKLDLVTANFADNSVSVLVGNGDGTFGSVSNSVESSIVTAESSTSTAQVDVVLPVQLLLPDASPHAILVGPTTLAPLTTAVATAATSPGSTSRSSLPTAAEPSARFDPSPSWLAAPAEGLNLPTERDILAGMDIAGTLLTGTRPQANLVPQPQDTVVAIGALLPGDGDDRADRNGEAGKAAKEKMELTPYLISPVEDTLLGPPSAPKNVDPALGLSWSYSLAFESLLDCWEGAFADSFDQGDRKRPAGPLQAANLTVALTMVIALASTDPVAETSESLKRRPTLGK